MTRLDYPWHRAVFLICDYIISLNQRRNLSMSKRDTCIFCKLKNLIPIINLNVKKKSNALLSGLCRMWNSFEFCIFMVLTWNKFETNICVYLKLSPLVRSMVFECSLHVLRLKVMHVSIVNEWLCTYVSVSVLWLIGHCPSQDP